MGPISTLFVETGMVGGGSFESLYQALRVMDRGRIDPVVAFLNRTRYVGLMAELGVPAYVLTDLAYSKKIPWFFRRRFEKRSDRAFLKGRERGLRTLRFVHGPLLRGLGKVMQRHGTQLLYLNTQINRDMFGCLAAQDRGIPLVSHLRSMDGKTFAGAKRDFANQCVDVFIANSTPVKEYWLERGAVSDKLRVVFNAVGEEPVEPVDLRLEQGLGPKTRVIACVARLVPFKGHAWLLEAFARLRAAGRDAVLVLAGSGPEEQALRGQAASLGIGDVVRFLGFDPRGPGILAGADLVVLPSDREPFGRVLIEAMRAGVPVLGAASGGVLDIIRHEENGLLVDYGDADGLARAMDRMFDDQALRGHCIAGGLESVRTTFNLRDRTRDMEDIIEAARRGYDQER